jgi:hypothetical protein
MARSTSYQEVCSFVSTELRASLYILDYRRMMKSILSIVEGSILVVIISGVTDDLEICAGGWMSRSDCLCSEVGVCCVL